MKKLILSIAIGLSLLTFGAQAQQHSHEKMADKSQQNTTMSYETPDAFQEQLAEVYESSLALKEAFLASDEVQVKEAVNPVLAALAKVDMHLLKDKAHMAWMKHLGSMESSLKDIYKSTAINAQRKSFARYSEALYQSIKAFGIGDEEAYYQYCPMANDNAGASWLSDNQEIRNPYFGDKMLKCGTVKESL